MWTLSSTIIVFFCCSIVSIARWWQVLTSLENNDTDTASSDPDSEERPDLPEPMTAVFELSLQEMQMKCQDIFHRLKTTTTSSMWETGIFVTRQQRQGQRSGTPIGLVGKMQINILTRSQGVTAALLGIPRVWECVICVRLCVLECVPVCVFVCRVVSCVCVHWNSPHTPSFLPLFTYVSLSTIFSSAFLIVSFSLSPPRSPSPGWPQRSQCTLT